MNTRDAYLNLLRDALVNWHYLPHEPPTRGPDNVADEVRRMRRDEGRDWPAWAVTMCGRKRLDHIRRCIDTVVADGVQGDFIETGVWRGGLCIFARAALSTTAFGRMTDDGRRVIDIGARTVYVADSFEGLPRPDADKWPADEGSRHYERDNFRVSRAEVEANFVRFGVPLTGVQFLEGFFEDTLPGPVGKLSILRLDGDMYGSTMHTLRALYDHVEPRGFIISDDWTASKRERRAIEDFWTERGLSPEVEVVDWTCRAWRKE